MQPTTIVEDYVSASANMYPDTRNPMYHDLGVRNNSKIEMTGHFYDKYDVNRHNNDISSSIENNVGSTSNVGSRISSNTYESISSKQLNVMDDSLSVSSCDTYEHFPSESPSPPTDPSPLSTTSSVVYHTTTTVALDAPPVPDSSPSPAINNRTYTKAKPTYDFNITIPRIPALSPPPSDGNNNAKFKNQEEQDSLRQLEEVIPTAPDNQLKFLSYFGVADPMKANAAEEENLLLIDLCDQHKGIITMDATNGSVFKATPPSKISSDNDSELNGELALNRIVANGDNGILNGIDVTKIAVNGKKQLGWTAKFDDEKGTSYRKNDLVIAKHKDIKDIQQLSNNYSEKSAFPTKDNELTKNEPRGQQEPVVKGIVSDGNEAVFPDNDEELQQMVNKKIDYEYDQNYVMDEIPPIDDGENYFTI